MLGDAERRGSSAKRARMAPRDDAADIPAGLLAWLTRQLEKGREQAQSRHVRDSGASASPLRGPSAADVTSQLLQHVLQALPARADAAADLPPAADDDDDDDDGPSADGVSSLASARARLFRESGRQLSGALLGDWELAAAFYVRGEATLQAALATAAVRRDLSNASRHVISTHHRQLRARVTHAAQAAAQLASTEQAAALQGAWAAAVADAPALEAYAGAAAETGRRSWARASQRWCLEQARDFFSGGAGRAAARAARVAHFEAHGEPMTQDATAAVHAAARTAVAAAVGAGRRPRLVDIGSCFDPWRAHQNEFEVTAFDLMPGAAQVYRADALALRVGKPDSDAQVEPPADAADGAGRLLALPAGSFHVAVLSLVLSYIPDPLHRTQVVLLARRLLCDQAGLLLLVTPLSTDRSHRPERALPILKEWRAAIEALGFSRFAAARLPTVHGLAFRAVPPPSPPLQLAPMRIAYDSLGALHADEACYSVEEDADGA